MSVFDIVVATFNSNLFDKSLQKKLTKICTLVDDDLLCFKDNNDKLNVKGSLSSLTTLETKIKIYLKSDKVKHPDCQSRHISGIEAQKIGVLNTKGERKTVCREEKLPFLSCGRCSYKTKRPNHLEKHLKKHVFLQ